MQPFEAAPELETLTRRFYAAIARGDASTVREMCSNSIRAIGSEADEWWVGSERLAQHIAAQSADLGGQMRVVRASPQGSIEGSVGWVADREAAFALSDGSEIPFRFTGVFHRENGSWKLVQVHLSVAVANQDAIHRSPTESAGRSHE